MRRGTSRSIRHASRSAKLWAAGAAALLGTVSADRAMAQDIPLLGPEDTAIAIDLDATFQGPTNNGRYPAAESPGKAIDNMTGTKYLNFGGVGSGFIVTPSLPTPVESFQIRTANDAAPRDPSGWALYGFNGTLTTTDSGPSPAINQTGLAEMWTLIDSGAVTLPDTRLTLGPVVNVNPMGVGYQHYKMIFPTLKGGAGQIMQIDEIQFFETDDGDPNFGILNPTDPIIAVDETPAPAMWVGSSFPANESPARGIDQMSSTKYLNFGEERSGIIITNSGGPVQVARMELTTANDAPDRDPTSYELYGTNDPVTSEQNSNSNGTETWTLISSGTLDLPTARFSTISVDVNSPTLYNSYRLIFPTVRNAAAANSMQIADIQFYAIPEPSGLVLGLGGLAMLASRRRRRA